MPLLADFGTSWAKILDTSNGTRWIEKTKDLGKLRADLATGHNSGKRAERIINELIALGDGSLEMIDEPEFTVLDVGSRDVKYVKFKGLRVSEMNWSSKCGALTGFTLELINKYFSLDTSNIEEAGKAMGITCGVLGMEQLFEAIGEGRGIEEAVAEFTKGLANNAFQFIGRPEKFYLSGGMCENELFLKSFPKGVEIVPLGRFVLVEGLRRSF